MQGNAAPRPLAKTKIRRGGAKARPIEMARTTPAKAAGLNLLDRLYRNQMIVDLVFSQDERQALESISSQARSMLEAAQLGGLPLERAIHYALTGLEILAADNIEDIADRVELSTQSREALGDHTFLAVMKFSRDAALALHLAMAGHVVGNQQAVIDVVNALAEECRAAPAIVRYRLAERALAVEYPDSPLQVMTWLARMDVVRSAKFNGRDKIQHSLDPVSIRAVSLLELETFRRVVQSLSLASDPRQVVRRIMGRDDESVSEAAFVRLADVAKREGALAQAGPRMCVPLAHRWSDRGYIQGLFDVLYETAPWVHVELNKKSTAVSDIAAAMIARAKLKNPQRATYAEGAAVTLSQEVAEKLLEHGFNVNPQTLQRHYVGSHNKHLKDLSRCCEAVRAVGVALPATDPDILQLHQVVVTA